MPRCDDYYSDYSDCSVNSDTSCPEKEERSRGCNCCCCKKSYKKEKKSSSSCKKEKKSKCSRCKKAQEGEHKQVIPTSCDKCGQSIVIIVNSKP